MTDKDEFKFQVLTERTTSIESHELIQIVIFNVPTSTVIKMSLSKSVRGKVNNKISHL